MITYMCTQKKHYKNIYVPIEDFEAEDTKVSVHSNRDRAMKKSIQNKFNDGELVHRHQMMMNARQQTRGR